MFRSFSKLAGAGMIAVAGTLAPYSVDLGGQSDGPVPLMRLNTACAAEADAGVDELVELAAGCVLSVYYVCETRHGDHVGYRNR